MSSFLEDDDYLPDPERPTTDRAPDPAALGVDISGTREHRILHAHGHLNALGGELLVALVARFLDEGCRRVFLNLAEVRTADPTGLIALRHLRSILIQADAPFWVIHDAHLRHRRAGPVGPA